MKNWIIYIGILTLFATNSWAQSVSIPKDPAMNDLHESALGKRQLETYEQQAMLKLKDLLDYTSIIGSNKYNESMRKAALRSVIDDFDEAARIHCDWIELGAQGRSKREKTIDAEVTCRPQKILEKLSENAVYEVQAKYENMKISKGLERSGNGSFSGQMEYELFYKTKKRKDSTEMMEQKKQHFLMNFELRRIQKKFGKEKEVVWEVQFLGNDQ